MGADLNCDFRKMRVWMIGFFGGFAVRQLRALHQPINAFRATKPLESNLGFHP